MSESEERQKKALALLEYTEGKQTIALLLKDAQDIAEQCEAAAYLLKDDPTRIEIENSTFPTGKQIFELAEKIRQAYERQAKLQRTVEDLGLTV